MTHFLSVLDLMTSALRRRLAILDEAPPAEPLDHPDLGRLSLRDLADLPLPRPEPRQSSAATLGDPEHDTASQESDDLCNA